MFFGPFQPPDLWQLHVGVVNSQALLDDRNLLHDGIAYTENAI